ncbi:hypothetical protein EMCRGX_G017603 [Ephydatia muelleri]
MKHVIMEPTLSWPQLQAYPCPWLEPSSLHTPLQGSCLSHRHLLLLWLQVILLGVASLIPAVTHWFFKRKESIPFVVHGFSWCTLTLLTGPVRAPGHLGHTLLCLFTIFTLMRHLL